jgi:hypothetical protein
MTIWRVPFNGDSARCMRLLGGIIAALALVIIAASAATDYFSTWK